MAGGAAEVGSEGLEEVWRRAPVAALGHGVPPPATGGHRPAPERPRPPLELPRRGRRAGRTPSLRGARFHSLPRMRVLAHGFARLACAGCRAEALVPFSCKSRGVCPSCNARRAQDTAIHLVERVLPRAPHRQWTLSFPVPVRFCLARDARLLSEVLGSSSSSPSSAGRPGGSGWPGPSPARWPWSSASARRCS
jgi:hypothetical protein